MKKQKPKIKMIIETLTNHSFEATMRKVYLTFIVTFTVSLCCLAYDTAELYQVLSPEVAAMTRYGNYPVSLYTGTVNISLPLYTIKNQDFEIPLNISYDASGFIPNHPATAVGQNWALNYGGMIVREVRGIPDEHSINNDGVFSLMNYDTPYPLPPKNDLKNLTYAGDYLMGTAGLSSYGVEYRYEQDIFTVILPNGSSFKFLIGNNGEPQIIGRRACKINLDGFEIITSGLEPNDVTSTIKVTDEDGFVYTFGGNMAKLERSYNFEPSTGVTLKLGVTNAWYLSKIEAPHSSLTYSYKSATVSEQSDNNMYLKTVCGKGAPVNSYTLAFTKQVLPERITSDNILIDFHYSLQTNTFYGNYIQTITHTYVQPNYQLDSITVTDRASNAKRVIRFSYTLAQWNLQSYYGHRRFLTGLDIDGRSYSITYNSIYNLPFPITNYIDKYGFYCPGQSDHENTGLHPSEGMLKKITYPSGGSTEFEFENHTYGYKIYRYTGGSIRETGTSTGNNYLGGVRIKRIANSDSTVTEYSYTGGVYYQSLRRFFYIEDDVLKEGYSDNFNYVSSCNYRGEPRIGYTMVSEKRINTTSGPSIIKDHTFTTRYDVPDIPPAIRIISGNNVSNTASGYESLTDAGLVKIIVSPNDSRPVNEYLSILNMDINYSSRAAERGLLTSVEEYNGVHQVRQTDFEYGVTRNQRDDYTVSAENFKGISLLTKLAYSYLTYHYTCEPTRKTVKTYDSNNNYVTETFIYNRAGLTRQVRPHNMITSALHATSDGDTITTIYKRPLDYGTLSSYNDSATRGLYELQQKNIVSPVIEEASFKGDSIINGAITVFTHDNTSGNPMPKYIYRLNQNVNTSDYSETAISGGNFLFNSNIYYKYLTYDLYNGKGRLLQYTDRSGIPVSFIWGYSHQKLLATVTGGEYLAFSNNWGGSYGADNMYYNGLNLTPSDSHYYNINSLRSFYQVTSYKYNPLYGVTSITDPLGVTTFFDYYPTGELKSRYQLDSNGGKEVLNAYQYYYQQPAN